MNEFLEGLKEGFKEFSGNVSIIINTILLSIVYFVGVGITSIFAKLVGKHFLDIKHKNANSYWSDLNLSKEPIENYYRQF